MRQIQKRFLLSMLVVGFVLVSGCHKNPLTTARHAITIPNLVEVSRLAEIKMSVKEADGWAYYYCMDEKSKSQVDCDALYNAMVDVARKNKVLKGLTKADITNNIVFEGIVDDYFDAVFNRMEGGNNNG